MSSVQNIKAQIEPGLGDVAVLSVSGKERMSMPYEYVVEVKSVTEIIEPYSLIDKKFTVDLYTHEDSDDSGLPDARLHGHCARIEQVGKSLERDYYIYELTLVPKLEYLKNTRCSEVFLEKSAKSIVKGILDKNGMAEHVKFWSGTGEKPEYEYKVQFEESDFDFCQRILANEGIFYFFDRETGDTKLVFGDKKSHYLSEEPINYQSESHGSYEEKAVHGSRLSESNPSNEVMYRAYNHLDPEMKLAKKSKAKTPAGGVKTIAAESELYSFVDSRNYNSSDRITTLNTIEKERLVAESAILTLDCNTIALYPGKTMMVESSEDYVAADKQLLVIGSDWKIDFSPSTANTSKNRVTNQLRCIPQAKVYRPPLPAEPKRIPGLQTATVVGQSGAVLDTEGHLRVKVLFHWDKEGSRERNSSCWIRVTQGIAGEGYGMFFPPRLGQEVVVGFLGGDPDAPILVGSVYNDQKSSPYKYPAQQNRSGFRSRTVGGGTGQYNEVSFEDTSGKEELFFRAQKDHKIHVLDSENRKVDKLRTTAIGVDDTLDVGSNQDIKIGNNLTEVIAKNYDCSSTSYNLSQSKTFKHTTGTDYSVSVGSSHSQEVGKSSTLQVGQNLELTVGQSYTVKVSEKVNVKAQQMIEVESPAMIKLTCGGATIEMLPGVINITGMVNFK